MPVRPITSELPAVVSVSEMARRVGLRRSRFYDLVKVGIFPAPVYCRRTRRPMFLTEQQAECMKVKATNVGANGQYVLFYAPRSAADPRLAPRQASRGARITTSLPAESADDLVSGLRALGMGSVTPQQVSAALVACFPEGWHGREEGEVLRACWSHLRRAGAA